MAVNVKYFRLQNDILASLQSAIYVDCSDSKKDFAKRLANKNGRGIILALTRKRNPQAPRGKELMMAIHTFVLACKAYDCACDERVSAKHAFLREKTLSTAREYEIACEKQQNARDAAVIELDGLTAEERVMLDAVVPDAANVEACLIAIAKAIA